MKASRTVWVIACATALLLGGDGCLITPNEADCASATTCDACEGRSGCGWCGSSGQCVAGNSIGPRGATCGDWRFATCELTPLSREEDPNGCDRSSADGCSSCASSSRGCGFCVAEGRCRSLSAGGDPVGGCRGNVVIRSSSSCNATVCPTQTTCQRCVGGSDSCYWCRDSNTCAASSSACPSSNYAFLESQCR